MTATPRLPEHPPHPPHVPCTDVIAALAPPDAPPAAPPPPAEPPKTVDLPVPPTRWGPLRRGTMLALRSNRQLDAAGQERKERALAEARAVVDEEDRARNARTADLVQALAEDHGPIELPEGYGLRDIVEKDGTYLELVEVRQKKPGQPARRGS